MQISSILSNVIRYTVASMDMFPHSSSLSCIVMDIMYVSITAILIWLFLGLYGSLPSVAGAGQYTPLECTAV